VRMFKLRERERKKSLGRRRRRWKDNIRMFVKEMGLESVDWIQLANIGTSGGFARLQ
jgi:hypothetical protein